MEGRDMVNCLPWSTVMKPLIVLALIAPGSALATHTTSAGEPRAASDAQIAPTADLGRPRIVSVDPRDGATEVDPRTEVRIRFDRPMNPTRTYLDWQSRGVGFRLRGELRYSTDTHEFVIPVQLTPGSNHRITAGTNRPEKTRPFGGFESADHVIAEPFTWSFSTANPVTRSGTPPRVLAVAPPSDSEVALFTLVEVTFDRPMDRTAYGLEDAAPGEPGRKPFIIGQPEYDPAKHQFSIALSLPPNWNGEVTLKGFLAEDGVDAGPMVLKYRTMRRPFSEPLQKKVEGTGDPSRTLQQLVEKVRDVRRKLTSLSEEAVSTSTDAVFLPDWYQRFRTEGSQFKMQGDRKFMGEVDAIMGIPFRIGSDGVRCWLVRENQLVTVPFESMEEKNLAFCDPFRASRPDDTARIIRDQKLEYLGEAILRGHRCHRIRSWQAGGASTHLPGKFHDWFIDAETLLPSRVETILIHSMRAHSSIDFSYARVNQPIPDEEFRPETIARAPRPKAESEPPLAEGYIRRFINVSDGSNGRISVRWGMKGPKGTSSSGLN
jgi:Big-like domain-containing protein